MSCAADPKPIHVIAMDKLEIAVTVKTDNLDKAVAVISWHAMAVHIRVCQRRHRQGYCASNRNETTDQPPQKPMNRCQS